MKLAAPLDLTDSIARLLSSGLCKLEVQEDHAFGSSNWLNLGSIEVKSASTLQEAYTRACRRGGYVWTTPSVADTTDALSALFAVDALGPDDKKRAMGKIRRLLDTIATTVMRVGLVNPVFDPGTLESMPFQRPCTVVTDTSGIIQGALNFITSYLHPAARIKVPGIVHMEIVNFGDRFISNRHDTKPRTIDLTLDHIRSQAGHRVLLGLELRSNTEIERTFLLGDPLRNAFQPESDKDLRGLNLTGIINAYCDRLILEAARHHQAQSAPGHRVHLLTADQGLARMALAEGLMPIYYRAVKASDMLGKTLSGVTLNPFTGKIRSFPLTDILWELATAFGTVRLSVNDETYLTVSAIGKDLPWSPYQSQEDLLWFEEVGISSWGNGSATPSAIQKKAKKQENPRSGKTKSLNASESRSSEASRTDKSVPVFRFHLEKLFNLVLELDAEGRLSEKEVMDTISAKKLGGIEEFRRFLTSGKAISLEDRRWEAEPKISRLAEAIIGLDIDALSRELHAFPSCALLQDVIKDLPIGHSWDFKEFSRAKTAYKSVAEILEIGCLLEDGMYATPLKPSLENFANIAIDRFKTLSQGDELVATGAWLEDLIKIDGIHPNVARKLLDAASEKNLLKRSTEGSTTDTRFEERFIYELEIASGKPAVNKAYLYRGDFLIPGKSSSSLRIERTSL
ncbi:hypothetical protein [Agrobacterium burrii]